MFFYLLFHWHKKEISLKLQNTSTESNDDESDQHDLSWRAWRDDKDQWQNFWIIHTLAFLENKVEVLKCDVLW